MNYCNRCGRRVADVSAAGKPHRTNPLVIVGNTAGVGFVAYIFVLLVLIKNGGMQNLFVPITFFYFAALFGICFLVLQYSSAELKPEGSAPPAEDMPPQTYLKPVITAQLEEARDVGIGSVTDATTRTLDEVRIERR
ncbi:MAG TPA: hypothetical protein VNA22_00885 [Pyrinomonadaceae bacterium]|nr:hypothetical protein [Pyrinomonadaceae bacterium]